MGMRGQRLALWTAALWIAGSFGAVASEPFMAIGGRTTQPVGHYEFCRRLPAECSVRTARPHPVELSRKLWKEIIQINHAVNTQVAPLTDYEMWGREEFWSYPDTVGDCEDYVLEKRRRLMAIGVPASNLLVTVVRQPNGDGHAVLTVETHLGDFVLDNLEALVLPWSETNYSFLKRQSSRNSGEWVSIQDGRSTSVASVQ